MNIIDKLKNKTKGSPNEEWLMEQKVGDLFDYLAYKLMKEDKAVRLTIMYLDVKYTITCEGIDATEFAETLKEKIKEL